MDDNLQLALYDKEAGAYDAFAATSPTWELIEAPAFSRMLKPLLHSATKLLDIGCGAGRLTAHLTAAGAEERNTTGVDISEKMLTLARAKLPRVTFIRQDIQALDLPCKSYDLATANMVFESLDNEQLYIALGRMREHLKPGGTLAYVSTHPLRNLGPEYVYLDRKWIEVTTPWGARLTDYHRPVGDFVNITHDAGFCIADIQELGIPLGLADEPMRERYNKCLAIRIAIKAVAA